MKREGKHMKIGLWTDSHYSTALLTCGKRRNSASLEKIRKAMQYFCEQGCDLAICLGDLIDRESNHEQERYNLMEIAAVLDEAGLPTICLMGNHDAFAFTPEEFYAILGERREPRLMQECGRNLLFIDACHFKTGVHYAPGDTDWTDTFYPHPEQLRQTLQGLVGKTYLFMHQNIDPGIRADHRLSNDAVIREIIDSTGTVCTVIQGHYHPGYQSENNGVRYITLPAMCEGDDRVTLLEI